jgi:nucleotide-binding universal stress UspA family protein
MSDVLLVVLVRPDRAAALLNAALRISDLVDCVRINVLGVREPNPMPPLSTEFLIDEADSILAERAREGERIAALKAAYDGWVSEAGERAAITRWVEAEGSAAAVVGERGSRADMVVASAPTEEDHLLRQTFRAALFGTGRPVLMISANVIPANATTTFGRCVAIAWRDDKQTARAVIPALRCLTTAEHVHVITGMRDRVERPVMPRILVEHGIRADLHVLPTGTRPFGQTLLDKTHELGADLLVMGAYAHSPLRELILGGVTRYMLTHADLPILMRH